MDSDELNKIAHLLRSTDMTIPDIAERMGRSRSVIVNINHRLQIRDYRGGRAQWSLIDNSEKSENANAAQA